MNGLRVFCFLCLFLATFTVLGDEKKKMDLSLAKARWVRSDAILWKTTDKELDSNCNFYLYTGNVKFTEKKGWQVEKQFSLSFIKKEDKEILLDSASVKKSICEVLKDHVVVVAKKKGKVISATTVQKTTVLDELFGYSGKDLGVSFIEGKPRLKLWAPTALSVKVHLFENSTEKTPRETKSMKATKGVWEITLSKEWKDKFYLYEVQVFTLTTQKIENNLVTDPYSVSVSNNGERSQILDLDDPKYKPKDWDQLQKPKLESVEDIVLYELHTRDFSIFDLSVPEKYRGTFMAFTLKDSNGMKHLMNLQRAGLTHIHLLPVFDIATIEERKELRKEAKIDSNLPGDSEEQQKEVGKYKDEDGFNWGYDPHHYGVPEGSYSTNPDGPQRILEFRKMIQSLSKKGLRVIMDVVYNHTHSCGQNSKSVLDKIVPGYYYRYGADGKISTSSCCADTASERMMMEKLMIETLCTWAKHYKVDGFRFDLMGHHSKSNMEKVRKTLESLTLEKDGVDGKKIYLYGEGWCFGSLNDEQPNEAFHQLNTYGYGIGTFNDRIRDSVRGGNFMHNSKSDQGFINGLYYDYNHEKGDSEIPKDLEKQKQKLLNYMDNIRIGMAGNLKYYKFMTAEDKVLTGGEINYRGSGHAGYTAFPRESINYVSAHDNYTLWDQITAKAPFQVETRKPQTATPEEKGRMQNLALAISAFGQGIPFFHAGIDMLRSKSGDGDSYNSGDWFNRLDFTYETNNWGAGLPPEWKNKYEWNFWRLRLADKTLSPSKQTILFSVNYFQALLRVRKSSKLFRLHTKEQICERLKFLNAEKGSKQIPGLIVMKIDDSSKQILDEKRKQIICLFNATREKIDFTHKSLKTQNLVLHPALDEKVDPRIKEATYEPKTGTITIPARSTLVYYEPRK